MKENLIKMVKGDDIKIVFTPDDYVFKETDSAYFCAAHDWNTDAEIYVNGVINVKDNTAEFLIKHEHTDKTVINNAFGELYYNIKIISDGVHSTPVRGILRMENEVEK
ncbi:MAG: hypothetical protein IJC74_02325 [Clostridia bacterium]|nr:hypothetical protein [Clostridia bacterium]